jgi:hypothetical protein
MAEQLFPQPEDHDKKTVKDEESTSRIAEWIIKNQKTFMLTFAVVSLLAVLTVWRIASSSQARSKSFEQAHFLAEELETKSFSPDDDDESARKNIVSKLQVINDKYPELNKRYDGVLAQEHILDRESDEIDPYAKRAINQLNAIGLNQFATFSDISRLAAQNKLDDARNLALQLDASLKDKANPKTFALRAYTLLQLVALNKKLGLTDDAQKKLSEAASLLQDAPTIELTAEEKQIASEIRQAIKTENISLLEFLKK